MFAPLVSPPRPARSVLLPLLALDVLLVGLGAVHEVWLRDVRWLSLGADAGLAESVQHLKTFAVAAGGAALFWRTREPVYAGLTALFAGLFVDDVATLHEVWGERLAAALDLPALAGLRGQDAGEVLFLAAWVAPVAVAIVLGYRRSGAVARADARAVAVAAAALAVFGVGVDAAHQAALALDVRGLSFVLTAFEEGGEMAVMSVIVAGTAAAVTARRPPAPGAA